MGFTAPVFDAGVAVGVGPGFGAGPLETTSETVLPRGRTVPAAGEALRTVPTGMVGSDFSVVAGWRPAASTAASASARSVPTAVATQAAKTLVTQPTTAP